MKINLKQIVVIIVVFGLLWMGWRMFKPKQTKDEMIKIVNPHMGDIKTIVSTTGTVLPKNRLEIKPPVNGRIEEVFIKEGQHVKAGETVVTMSSTERAALLDAARGQGEEKLNYWRQVYKPIPLVAPIDGEVIVGTVQPGQTVTTSDPVIVLSDRLIVRAQVDETDIGKIKEGQVAVVSLDAYPKERIDASVDHIYYESKTVNNVTIYEVDLLVQNIPDFFRSGMNTNVDFIEEDKKNVMLLPINSIQREKGRTFVLVQPNGRSKPIEKDVTVGLSDDKSMEIVSGLSLEDDVILQTKRYSLPRSSGGTNPFMPARGGAGSRQGGR
jgi:macrolide-specific efflux system membrane fusion protein